MASGYFWLDEEVERGRKPGEGIGRIVYLYTKPMCAKPLFHTQTPHFIQEKVKCATYFNHIIINGLLYNPKEASNMQFIVLN